MNLRDDEWKPEPSDPTILRRVRAEARSIVSLHDLTRLRTYLLDPPLNGAIPHEMRGDIWLLLLRLRKDELLVEDTSRFAQAARHAVRTDNSREQIEKDVERTRPGLERFKQPAVRSALLRLLSLFCERHKVTYVQGLNELLAPFILLEDTGSIPRIAYALFSAFVARFAPWTLESSETRMFEVLKRLFKYFERLLLYHDPELYWLLERHAMTPDLYATSWFITLFSRNFTVESVLALWDLLLLEDDPLGTSFFAIALLRSKRDILLEIDESRIPETLMLLTADSPEQVRHLWAIGSEMRIKHTPPSFQRLMTDRIVNDGAAASTTVNTMSAARSMQGSVCLQTTPDDLGAGDTQYFALDCRTRAEYDTGRLAQAAFLPLDHVREMNGMMSSGDLSDEARAELYHAADLCEQLKGSSHICLIGSGIREEDKADINVLADYLTRIGIPYVSTLRGGFEDALSAVKKDDSMSSVDLVDYDRRKHDHARRARVNAQKKRDQEMARLARRSQYHHALSDSKFASATTDKRRVSMDGLFTRNSTFGGRRRDENINNNGNTNNTAGISSSSFLDKSDAEVSSAFSKALASIGLNYTFSGASSGASGDREEAWSAQNPSVTIPPAAMAPLRQNSSIPAASPISSITTSGADTPHRVISAGLQRQATENSNVDINELSKKWSSDFSTTYLPEIATSMVSPESDGRPVASADTIATPSTSINGLPSTSEDWERQLMSTSPTSDGLSGDLQKRKSSRRIWGGGGGGAASSSENITDSTIPTSPRSPTASQKNKKRSPWVRDAKPGWLSAETMEFPLSAMPKGFTVNMMDDQVMQGLRLFPCKARAERMTFRGKSSEFRKRFIGVSQYYLVLLGPYSNRQHLLEVKLIRYLQDILRITFKRSRPELVTFSIHSPTDQDDQAIERVVCLMPDGLKECVDLIRGYLSGGSDNDQDSKLPKDDQKATTDPRVNIQPNAQHAWRGNSSAQTEEQPRTKSEGALRNIPVMSSLDLDYDANSVDGLGVAMAGVFDPRGNNDGAPSSSEVKRTGNVNNFSSADLLHIDQIVEDSSNNLTNRLTSKDAPYKSYAEDDDNDDDDDDDDDDDSDSDDDDDDDDQDEFGEFQSVPSMRAGDDVSPPNL